LDYVSFKTNDNYEGGFLRIAYFVWEFLPRIIGGLGTYASEITREFVKKGHDVSLFTLNDAELKTREIMSGIEVHRPILLDMSEVFPDMVLDDIRRWGTVGLEFFSNVFLYNILSASKFINQLVVKEEHIFDIIVAHDWLSSIAAIISKKRLNLPFVFHIHSTEQGRSLGNGSKTIIELERKAFSKAETVITVSNAMKEELVSHGYPEEKIRVVWNGVDPLRYDPSKVSLTKIRAIRSQYGVEDEEKMIMCIARLTSVKGVDKLILAMSHVVRKHPKAKLVLIGLGGMENHLISLTESTGLKENVKFNFSFLREDERIAHYAAADIVVVPSLYEPFGIVALEAMAMEKPVVVGARGISGLREIVISYGSEQNGFHVNAYDPADIAWGINSILEEPEKIRYLGIKGRQRVLKEFTWEKAAEKTLKIYEEVASKVKS
jgi:glycogen(starch) synthase